jgi:long-subunit acyl-CoA synthetase (AMP-forming)
VHILAMKYSLSDDLQLLISVRTKKNRMKHYCCCWSDYSGLAVGIYATNSPEACRYVAVNAQCNIVVVENDQQLKKFLKIRDNLPHLKAIIQYKGSLSGKYSSVYSVGQNSLTRSRQFIRIGLHFGISNRFTSSKCIRLLC